MTCRHRPGDPSCSANRPTYQDTGPPTPDKTKYTIEEVERVGLNLVLKVLYPNCSRCAYKGNKVLVYLNVSEKDVLRWRVIDPHFRAPHPKGLPHEAPTPAARFPASPEGWQDALAYARSKSK